MHGKPYLAVSHIHGSMFHCLNMVKMWDVNNKYYIISLTDPAIVENAGDEKLLINDSAGCCPRCNLQSDEVQIYYMYEYNIKCISIRHSFLDLTFICHHDIIIIYRVMLIPWSCQMMSVCRNHLDKRANWAYT